MKYFLSYLIFFSILLTTAQENNNSLLWEISGNGLQKSSYLYGTMHVSNKVAFRLDDVFFTALNNSDYVALESDPSDWLEYNFYTTTLFPQNYTKAFKSDFYSNIVGIETPKDLLVRSAIRFNNRLVNGILYRKDSSKDNFEEETYLDMFIFQAGKKTNKPIISLEDIEESRYLVSKASRNSKKDKVDPWLAKLYKKESAYLLRENTYRDRNVQFLDSISQASNSEYFRENMLYIRNENMVKVLDSIMTTRSVFSGVGAAHLGGEKGMITMLRDKGYTVKPLQSLKTDLAITEKERLENTIKTPVFSSQSTPDNFLTLNAYGPLREFLYGGIKYYISPDLPNGAHLTISRINTFNYLPNENNLELSKIENYLFEDIPGKIISKTPIKSPFPGLSIVNQTKKGDYEKYHIYQTPLEFVIIKLSGLKDYVLNFEDQIFSSIKFKEEATKISILKSANNKLEVNFPDAYITDNFEYAGNKLFQAGYKDSFYFIRESVYHDTYYIEEDAFEAKYMLSKFLKNLELENYEITEDSKSYKSYKAIAELENGNELHLKSIVKDGSYYTLGFVGTDAGLAQDFFKSVKFNDVTYPENFKTVIDTSLHFSVNTNTKTLPPRKKTYTSKTKAYEENELKTTYYSKANEQIYVTKYKYHDLQMFPNVDTLWNNIKSSYKYYGEDDNEYKNFNVKNENKSIEDGMHTYTFTLSDSTSIKEINIKQVLKKGTLFELRYLSDSLAPKSRFVAQFYDSFTPLDTLLGKDIFKDKTNIFLDALKANDSIVFGARTNIKFYNKHAEKLMSFINEFEFPENKKDLKLFMVEELAGLSHPKLNTYLETLYENSYDEPSVQIAILNSFYDKDSSKAFKRFIKLLNKDLPLDKSEIGAMFNNYNDSLSFKKELFPALLDYTTINEYKGHVYELLSRLVIKDQIKSKTYKSYKKQIINDGKIELKRSISNNSSNFKGSYNLIDYVYLIFPFRKDANAKIFFKKLIESKNGHAQASYYSLLARENEFIPKALKEKTIYNDEAKYLVLKKLYHKKLYAAARLTGITQQSYVKSFLFANAKIEDERDSILFAGKKDFVTDLDKKGEMYFYKLIKTTDEKTIIRLYYFGLLKENIGKIIVKPYCESGVYGDLLDENKPEEDVFQELLDKAIHKTRKRLEE